MPDSSVAFWTYPEALMLGNGVPPELIRFWRTEARCVRVNQESALCFPRE